MDVRNERNDETVHTSSQLMAKSASGKGANKIVLLLLIQVNYRSSQSAI
jgi:hypothetical protein